jgi:hypothetical protein
MSDNKKTKKINIIIILLLCAVHYASSYFSGLLLNFIFFILLISFLWNGGLNKSDLQIYIISMSIMSPAFHMGNDFYINDIIVFEFIYLFIFSRLNVLFNYFKNNILIFVIIISFAASILLSDDLFALLMVFIKFILFVIVLIDYIVEVKYRKKYVYMNFFLLGIFIAFIETLKLIIEGESLTNSILSTIYLAGYFVPFLLFYFVTPLADRKSALFNFFVLSVIVVLSYWSVSRSLFVAISYTLFMLLTFYTKGFVRMCLLPLTFLTLILTGFYGNKFDVELVDSYKSESNIVRYIKVSNSLSAFIERPILGYGFGKSVLTKEHDIDTDYKEKFEKISETYFSPEITVVQILVEIGLIGFLLFCILFLRIFKLFFTNSFSKSANSLIMYEYIIFTSIIIFSFIRSNGLQSQIVYVAIFSILEIEIFYRYIGRRSTVMTH